MSLRSNGSYIGPRPTGPVGAYNGAASGIWDLRTAQRQQAAGTWPIAEFTPDVLTGLQLWLDASDASTLYDATSGGSLVAADGGVARWEDKSGNARHATQGTSANRPARKTAIQGGKDVLRFDGSNDSLSIASSTAAFKFLHSQNSTVFAVFKSGTTANPGHAAYTVFATTNGAGNVPGMFLDTSDRNPSTINDLVYFYVTAGIGGESTYPVAVAENNYFASNVFGLLSVVSKPADATSGNRVALRRNGGNLSTTNSPSSNESVSTANANQNFTLGAYGGAAANFLNGDIAEIIIYNSALSDTDREAVENYLLAKWAIT